MPTLAHRIRSFLASFYWFLYQGRWRIKDVFDDLYEGQQRGETLRGIFRDVFGDEYADEADPTGFLTMTDLRNLAKHLSIAEGDSLVDLACGLGGAGLWVARQTSARLTGIDISSVAVEKASTRIADFGLTGRAEFRVGDFAATDLPEAAFAGAMSVDSLFLVPDKIGSVRETARILRPAARFVFTTWELDMVGGVRDYRPLLEQHGFEVEVYDTTPNWEAFQRAIYERILAEREVLIREMGKKTAMVWVRDAQAELPRLPRMRRVLIAARKK
ncbi:MAG: methyltransferase domain-containing protein [Pirellulaceae bacterium]|nr:methyltransferase domain-containing protein [Pirellulaceae bacterium]